MSHKDNTHQPVESGVYVNRYESIPYVGSHTNTVKVADSLSELAETALIDPTGVDIRRWWYETHSERLIVIE